MDTAELQKLRIDKGPGVGSGGTYQRGPRRGRAVVLFVLGIVVAVIAWRIFFGGAKLPEVAVQNVVLPDGVVLDDELIKLEAAGYIIAAHKIEVASKVVGRVAWVGNERGDRVEQGQVVVKLEDEEYKARLIQQEGILAAAQARLAEFEAGSRPEEVAQARALLDQSIVELENAETNLKRLKELEPTKSVARQDIDDAESLVRSRRARAESVRQSYNLAKAGVRKEIIDAQRAVVRQMEGGVRLARVDLDNTVIKAPSAGTVLERNVEVGEFVTTGFVGDRGAKGYVVSLADLSDLRVELDISQGDFAKVEPGQSVWIEADAYPDRRYEGVVDLIAPEANRAKASVQVRVKVLKPDGLLRPDMNAKVSFLDAAKLETRRKSDALPVAQRPRLTIPASAVRDGGVFVIEKGKAVRRKLTLGDTTGDQIEVRKGLRTGVELVVSPPETLKDGDPVKVKP